MRTNGICNGRRNKIHGNNYLCAQDVRALHVRDTSGAHDARDRGTCSKHYPTTIAPRNHSMINVPKIFSRLLRRLVQTAGSLVTT